MNFDPFSWFLKLFNFAFLIAFTFFWALIFTVVGYWVWQGIKRILS